MKNIHLFLFLFVFYVPYSSSSVISKLFLESPQSATNILSFEDIDQVKNSLEFTSWIRVKTIDKTQSRLKFQVSLKNGNSHLRIIFEQLANNKLKMHMVGVEINDNGIPMTAVKDKKTQKITLLNPPERKKLTELPNKSFEIKSFSTMKVAVTGLQERTLKIDINIGNQIESYLVDVNFGINSVDIGHLSGELNLLNLTYE
uniref:Uncharacterized protein n=1 Tax=Colwellia sp. C1 TaxID=1737566 RepID=A0A0P0KTP4_9GAMM|nr:hypothetical protein [Colwellia sp. C1]